MADDKLVKLCPACNVEQPLSEYFFDKRRKYGPSAGVWHKCKSCTAKAVKKRRGADPGRFRAWENASAQRRFPQQCERKRQRSLMWRLRKFGITPEDFMAMLEKQDWRCAICLRPIMLAPPGRGSRDSACLDHNHQTGAIRGILCHGCNTAIGLLGDDPKLLSIATAYLLRFAQ